MSENTPLQLNRSIRRGSKKALQKKSENLSQCPRSIMNEAAGIPQFKMNRCVFCLKNHSVELNWIRNCQRTAWFESWFKKQLLPRDNVAFFLILMSNVIDTRSFNSSTGCLINSVWADLHIERGQSETSLNLGTILPQNHKRKKNNSGPDWNVCKFYVIDCTVKEWNLTRKWESLERSQVFTRITRSFKQFVSKNILQTVMFANFWSLIYSTKMTSGRQKYCLKKKKESWHNGRFPSPRQHLHRAQWPKIVTGRSFVLVWAVIPDPWSGYSVTFVPARISKQGSNERNLMTNNDPLTGPNHSVNN